MILEEQNAFFRIQTGLRLRLSHFHDNLSFVHKLHSCHPVNRLLYIRKYPGSNAYIYDYKAEEKFFLREGYLYFYPCFREIEIYQEQDLAYRSIHFNVDLFDCGDLFAGSPVRELGGELAEGIAKLPAVPKSIRDCCLFNAVLNHLTAVLLENEEEFIWNPILRESKYRDLFRYVHENLSAELSVESLAAFMKMGREVFSRRFRADFGFPPKEFLTRMLLSRASDLLLSPNMRVKEVAARLKFQNEFYFSRFFRKHTNIPPSDYSRFYRDDSRSETDDRKLKKEMS